ncbi:MAG TPA: MFS transporter, partial [Methanocorpusculum sp.]|nr:MFS transporter [Methanocorpusculum sp.]
MIFRNRHLQRYLPPWLIIFLITILTIVGPCSTDMYLPGLMEIVEYFDTTEAILNITLYGFLFAQAVAILFLGAISDKYGRKPILLISIIVYIISSILCGFAPNITIFIILRLAQGAATGGLIVIATALIKDCFEEKLRDKVLTLTVVFSIIGPLFAPIIGAVLIEYVNWQSTLIAPGIITVAALIITLFLSESLPKKEKYTGSISSVLKRLPALCRHKAFTLFLLSMSILNLPFMTYLAISSYIYEGTFGISTTGYSIMLAANVVAGTIGMIILQHFGKKIGMRKEGMIILALVLASGILMLTLGHLNPLICLLCYLPCALGVIT